MRKTWVLFLFLPLLSCGLMYKLRVKKVGDQLQATGNTFRSIVNELQGNPSLALQREWVSGTVSKLQQVRNELTEIQVQLEGIRAPGRYRDAHDKLKRGVQLLIEATDLMIDALNLKSIQKGREAMQKAGEAERLLREAADQIRG